MKASRSSKILPSANCHQHPLLLERRGKLKMFPEVRSTWFFLSSRKPFSLNHVLEKLPWRSGWFGLEKGASPVTGSLHSLLRHILILGYRKSILIVSNTMSVSISSFYLHIVINLALEKKTHAVPSTTSASVTNILFDYPLKIWKTEHMLFLLMHLFAYYIFKRTKSKWNRLHQFYGNLLVSERASSGISKIPQAQRSPQPSPVPFPPWLIFLLHNKY